MMLRYGLYFLSCALVWMFWLHRLDSLMFGAILCLLWAIVLKQVEEDKY